jgi:hypothetical protein
MAKKVSGDRGTVIGAVRKLSAMRDEVALQATDLLGMLYPVMRLCLSRGWYEIALQAIGNRQ